MEDIKIEFKYSTIENLKLFSQMLNKNIDVMLEEALEQYFDSEQKRLLEKNINDENAMTNLDYDEFWDGIELD